MLLGGYCGGCGNGNQSCAIARCGMEQGNIEYCFECKNYPCERYQKTDDYDIFITSLNRRSDLEKARQFGIEAYNLEQSEKVRILDTLLSRYNDGRKKTLFCAAVNLLELDELREALGQIEERAGIEMLPIKEKSAFVAGLLKDMAARKDISLKLRKKK